MHLNVAGPALSPAYKIEAGTPNCGAATGDPVSILGAPTGTLLDPGGFDAAQERPRPPRTSR